MRDSKGMNRIRESSKCYHVTVLAGVRKTQLGSALFSPGSPKPQLWLFKGAFLPNLPAGLRSPGSSTLMEEFLPLPFGPREDAVGFRLVLFTGFLPLGHKP